MKDTAQVPSRDIEVTDASGHASFILRCWMAEGQPVRARIVDVNTGVSRAVADLNALPGTVRDLVREEVSGKK